MKTFLHQTLGYLTHTLENGGLIAGINAKNCANYSRKQVDELTDFVKASHRGLNGLDHNSISTKMAP
jgi:aspartyl-tRNA synthetase